MPFVLFDPNASKTIFDNYLALQVKAMSWFYSMVNNDAPWDIKTPERWSQQLPGLPYLGISNDFVFGEIILSAEELGNYAFGYWGQAAGFSADLLLIGANVASLTNKQGFDSSEDAVWVQKGMDWFNRDYPK
jgi:hypothetical protein